MNIGVYPGAADILCTIHGKVQFVEVKTPTGRQSPKQVKFQEHCRQMGIPYHIVRSLEEFKILLT